MKQNHYSKALLLAIASFVVPVLDANAQISLTQSSYSSWTLGADTTVAVSSISVSPTVNGSWDLGSAIYGTRDVYTRTAVSGNATYPQSTYSVPSSYAFNSLLSYQTSDMQGITSSGLLSFGQALQRQAIPLVSLTMGANDSLVFNQQNIVYSSAKKNMAFPATTGSNWVSTYNYNLAFNLTVAAYSLNNVPGAQHTYITRTDSVVGWGKMRVKGTTGLVSGYMDVLAVKVAIQQRDSFFLNGSVAPTPLVTAFGLSQGQIHNSYYILYFRAGTPTALLSVVYSDASYATVSSAYAHAAKLAPAPTSVSELSLGNLSLYPNPLTGDELHLSSTHVMDKNCSYELINSVGQRVAAATIRLNNGKATIPLNQPAGSYFFLLRGADGQLSSQQLVIQK